MIFDFFHGFYSKIKYEKKFLFYEHFFHFLILSKTKHREKIIIVILKF